MMKNYAPIWRELASAGVALLVASGILIYTLHGDIKIANYYMWFEISVSAFYYAVSIGWDWWIIPAFSFVFMLPVSLKHYTTKLNKAKGGVPEVTPKLNTLEAKESEHFAVDAAQAVEKLTDTCNKLEEELKFKQEVIESRDKEIMDIVAHYKNTSERAKEQAEKLIALSTLYNEAIEYNSKLSEEINIYKAKLDDPLVPAHEPERNLSEMTETELLNIAATPELPDSLFAQSGK
jgi:hypothetical protein